MPAKAGRLVVARRIQPLFMQKTVIASLVNLWRRVGKEAFLLLSGQALGALAGLVAVRLLTAWYPRETYGVAWLFINGVNLISLLTAGALGQTVSRFYHDSETSLDSLLGLVWRTQIVVTVIVTIVYFATVFMSGSESSGIKPALFVMPAYFASLSFFNIAVSLLNTSRKRLRCVFLGVVDAWLKPCGALIACLVWKPDVNGFVLGYAASSILLGLIGYNWIGDFGKLPLYRLPAPDKKSAWRLLSYSLPWIAFAAIYWILSLSDRYIINWLLGATLTGTYVAAYQVGSALFQFMGGAFGPLVQPIVLRRGSSSPKAGGEIISLCYRIFAWFSLPVLTCFALSHEWLLRWMVVPAYRDGSKVVVWIGLGAYLWIFGNIGMDAFRVSKRNGPLVAITGSAAVANIALNIALVPQWGIVGAGISTFVSYAFYAAGIIVVGRKILFWDFPARSYGTAALLSCSAGLAAKGVHLLLLGGSYSVGSFACVMSVFVLALLSMALLLGSRLRQEYAVVAQQFC